MVKGKLKEIPGHEGFGRPARKLVLSEEVSCTGCASGFSEGDHVWFSFKDAGVYCKDCSYPSFSKGEIKNPNGERRVAGHVELVFLTGKSRDKAKQDVLSDYEDVDQDPPSGEQLETLVDKRLENENSDRNDFLEEAESLGALAS